MFAALFLATALLVCGCGPVEEPPAPAPCTHEYGEWQETTPATLLADGKCTRTCTLCGETEEKVINRKYLVTLATSSTSYETAVKLIAADFVTHFTETMALDASIWDLGALDFENTVYPTLKPLS